MVKGRVGVAEFVGDDGRVKAEVEEHPTRSYVPEVMG
jgi:hypothetical protein